MGLMPRAVKARAYNSERRRQASAQTRRRILDAAHDLFVAHGYHATTVAEVADRARVHVDTVYQLAGRKPSLLRELIEESISGQDHPVAAEQRDYVLAIRNEPDPARKIALYAHAIRRIQERLAPLFLALRDASTVDEDAAAVWREISDRRAANMRLFAQDLAAAGGVRAGLQTDAIADTVWVMNSSDVFVLLTRDRGWSTQRYEDWLAASWSRLILP